MLKMNPKRTIRDVVPISELGGLSTETVKVAAWFQCSLSQKGFDGSNSPQRSRQLVGNGTDTSYGGQWILIKFGATDEEFDCPSAASGSQLLSTGIIRIIIRVHSKARCGWKAKVKYSKLGRRCRLSEKPQSLWRQKDKHA
jgi:hypothetical protein